MTFLSDRFHVPKASLLSVRWNERGDAAELRSPTMGIPHTVFSGSGEVFQV